MNNKTFKKNLSKLFRKLIKKENEIELGNEFENEITCISSSILAASTEFNPDDLCRFTASLGKANPAECMSENRSWSAVIVPSFCICVATSSSMASITLVATAGVSPSDVSCRFFAEETLVRSSARMSAAAAELRPDDLQRLFWSRFMSVSTSWRRDPTTVFEGPLGSTLEMIESLVGSDWAASSAGVIGCHFRWSRVGVYSRSFVWKEGETKTNLPLLFCRFSPFKVP